MNKDWNEVVVICPNDSCADMVTNASGIIRMKRRMVYSGDHWWTGNAEFICPCCGSQRSFEWRLFSNGFREVKS